MELANVGYLTIFGTSASLEADLVGPFSLFSLSQC